MFDINTMMKKRLTLYHPHTIFERLYFGLVCKCVYTGGEGVYPNNQSTIRIMIGTYYF